MIFSLAFLLDECDAMTGLQLLPKDERRGTGPINGTAVRGTGERLLLPVEPPDMGQ